jgi:uncharacterized membrane protein YjfL (UPF0719 family)
MGDKLILGLFILFCFVIAIVAALSLPEWVLWAVEGVGVLVALFIYVSVKANTTP